MASMRDIKRRKGSIQSTQQITKAMKLVSTVKLQKAKTKAEESKPYFDTMYQTVKSILGMSENIRHPYLDGGTGSKKGVIVITSNRGLAGGYNSNITKLLTRGDLPKEDVVVYAVGKRGRMRWNEADTILPPIIRRLWMNPPTTMPCISEGVYWRLLNRVRSVKSTWLIQYSKIR